MKDIQNMKDERNLDINKVGVKNVTVPVIVRDKKYKEQHTIATFNMYVDLPREFKGTHMSRFVEVLNDYRNTLINSKYNMLHILETIQKKLQAKTAHVEMSFKYFIEKKAPVSNSIGCMDYDVSFIATKNKEYDFILSVKVPVTSLCPCSKEISKYGAHNQRSYVTVKIRFDDMIWIEDIVSIVEKSASCELYSILKRPDEKYVTEHAYENPRFVEDMVREVAMKLNNIKEVTWYSVESENEESIHNHNAYAIIEHKKGE